MKLPRYTSGPARHLGRLCAAWVFCCGVAMAAQGDPAEPYWQSSVPGIPIAPGLRLGGTYRRVEPHRPPTVKEFRAQIERERMQWELEREQRQETVGLWVKMGGIAVLVFGAFCHFSTSFPPLRSISSSIATVGGGIYVTGLLIQREAIYGRVIDWILFGILLSFLIFMLYRYREFSLSRLFFNKRSRKK